MLLQLVHFHQPQARLSTRLRLLSNALLNPKMMRVTRSATRALASGPNTPPADALTTEETTEVAEKKTSAKRKAPAAPKRAPAKRARSQADDASKMPPPPPPAPNGEILKPIPAQGGRKALVPAKLTFDLDEAKNHLTSADARFEDIFSRMPCRPYERLEQIDPFRTLTSSILGQQISWKAARSIEHKFRRLFDPSLPEKPDPSNRHDPNSFFPTAEQVAAMNIPTLRTAGLSQRKAEYVLDLAARFADGRLSTQKVLEAKDEELYEMLIAVRGIGRWTVDMFAIFSLRRPDILPVGDLGVQRGLLRWFLAMHSPAHAVSISPEKLPQAPDEPPTPKSTIDEETLPVLGQPSSRTTIPEDASSLPPAPAATSAPKTPVPKAPSKRATKKESNGLDSSDEDEAEESTLPTPFTPSINKTLNMSRGVSVLPLPKSLSVATLKSRLDTKKKVKGAFLTPQEMEELTEPWRPYRSLGVYYMWALAS